MMLLVVIVVIILLLGSSVWVWPFIAGMLGLSNVNDKPGAIEQITRLMRSYDITPAEVEMAFNTSINTDTVSAAPQKSDIAKTLFMYLGAIFILAGVGTYIGMFWDSMGSFMRILVTLGIGYVLFIVLIAALYEKKYPRLILPLTFASVFMMTGGWFVFIYELFPQGDNWRAATLFVFGVMALHQGVLFGKYHRTVFAFTSLFFIYGFMHTGLDMLHVPIMYIAVGLGASLFIVGTALQKTSHRILVEPALLIGMCWFYSGLFDRVATLTAANWASVVIGACIVSTAYGLQRTDRYPLLAGLAYFAGSVMLYSGLFDLVQNTAAELLYFAVTASILYACVVLRSRALLLTTVIAMLGFIAYYSAKHFADSLGWPLTLVLMGIVFVSIATIAVKVKQKI